MVDPTKILEREARRLYNAWRAEKKRKRLGFVLDLSCSWRQLSNWQREQWRDKALGAIRSKETVADELKREDRERERANG